MDFENIEFYKVEQVARILQVKNSTVYGLINNGLLKAYKWTNGDKNTIRISKEQIEKFLKDSE